MEETKNLLGHPADLKEVSIDETPFYCLDGRINKEVLGKIERIYLDSIWKLKLRE